MYFSKLTGSGNDFVVIDNRDRKITRRSQTAVRLCHRKFGIGADGLLLLEKSSKADFKMRIFNPDGSEAEMCGNGIRCILRFAVDSNIVHKKNNILVETIAGILVGQVSNNIVKSQLNLTGKPRLNIKIPIGDTVVTGHFLNTGVPHTVILTDDINSVDIGTLGPAIRYHKLFKGKGTNVDWVEIVNRRFLKIRTYERGVEGETLSCGTGSVAGGIVGFLLDKVDPPVTVLARSGERLRVYLDKTFQAVYLEGRIDFLFKGEWLGK